MQYHDDLKIIYWSIGILCAIFLVKEVYQGNIPWLAAILMLDLIFWAVRTYFNNAASKRNLAVIRLMNRQCALAEFIEQYQDIYNHTKKGEPAAMAALNLATAYMHLGDTQRATELFAQAKPQQPRCAIWKKKKTDNAILVHYAIYHNNLAHNYLMSHDITQAEVHTSQAAQYLEQLKAVKKKDSSLEHDINTLTRSLFYRRLEISLERGENPNEPQTSKQLQEMFENEPRMLMKVYNRYLACKVYEIQENREEAEKCREFVQKYGGDTCYVKKADAPAQVKQ